MDWFSFGLLLNDNIVLYLLMLFAALVVYYFIFKRMYLSILDPIVFSLVFSCFGFSVVWFLYFTKSIDIKYLESYIFTQIAFWLGLFTFKSLKNQEILAEGKVIAIENEGLFVEMLFLIASALYIVLQLLSYLVIGVPLLLGTHIDLYSNSGGWGLIGRFIDILKPVSIFLLIYFLFEPAKSIFFYIYRYFFLFLILVFFALSASKGEFMSFGLIFFCFLLMNASKYKKYYLNIRKTEGTIIIIGLCFVFLTIFIQSKLVNDDSNTLGVFLFRLVASGDTYYFSYPNHNIEQIKGVSPFLALFGDIFSTLRIIPRDQQPTVLGFQLYRMFSDYDISAGPNARQNVFGYVYFGFYGSIIFSYLIGLTLSFVRNKLFFTLKKNIVGQLIFMLLYIDFSALETDPPMAISNVENMMLIFPLILIITFVCFVAFIKIDYRKVKFA